MYCLKGNNRTRDDMNTAAAVQPLYQVRQRVELVDHLCHLPAHIA